MPLGPQLVWKELTVMPPEDEVVITLNSLLSTSYRTVCENLLFIPRLRGRWRVQDSDAMAKKDAQRHSRNLERHRTSQDQDQCPEILLAAFLFSDIYRGMPGDTFAEIYIREIMSTECLPAERYAILRPFPKSSDAHFSNHRVYLPPVLSHLADVISVDVLVQALPGALGWRKELYPILFVANHYDDSVDELKVFSELPYALHATMMVLILYYLDVRKYVEEHMPPQLDQRNIQCLDGPKFWAGRCGARSFCCCNSFVDLFQSNPSETLACLLWQLYFASKAIHIGSLGNSENGLAMNYA